MLTRLSKNVVCVKNVPSNLIEEAFFILKSNYGDDKTKNGKVHKEIVMSEIDELIDEYAIKMKEELDSQYKQEMEMKQKYKKIKVRTMLIASAFILVCLFIAFSKL